jgi:hypothetical protein
VRQGCHKQFVIFPQLESATLKKMAKMPDCYMCSQQFTIKRGETRRHVSQLSAKETKWPPMVPRFLLQDAADMNIEGAVARESSACGAGCWSGTTAARRRFAFWKASCAMAVYFNVLGPTLWEISQRVQQPVCN